MREQAFDFGFWIGDGKVPVLLLPPDRVGRRSGPTHVGKPCRPERRR